MTSPPEPLTVRAARQRAAGLLASAGVDDAAAAETAQALVLADAWGVHSHGLMRLPYYLRRLEAGGCNPKAELEVVSDTGPVLTYDGQDGLGHWQAWRAAAVVRDRCGEAGVAIAAVGRSSHCGALGVYTLPIIQAGYVAMVFSNGPAVMPPAGGDRAVLSTSPIAAGIPTRPRPAIVDLATSAVARGRVAARARSGEPLEPGWALDSDGRPTVDPAEGLAGMLAPLGGAKGYALAFLVESLTGGMVGPALSTEVVDMFADEVADRPQALSHLVLALDPAVFDVTAGATPVGARLDRLAASVVATGGRVPGSRRLLPDEIDPDAPLDLDASTLAELGGETR